MKFLAPVCALLALVSLPSQASSTESWKSFSVSVTRACISHSDLIITKASSPVMFDDTVGKVVVLMKGKLKGERKEIEQVCLYDKPTKAVSIAELTR